MHTLVEVAMGGNGGTHVPAFLAKLWKIVDDVSTNDLICWSETGNSFIIRNQAKFARDLLPLYYKHNNMASFVRQLNMYGFHKVVSVEQGGLRVDKDEMEFAHPFFLKGQEGSLELIKRKIPASKHEESRMRPDSLNKVLIDVRQMKGRQETMDNKLVTMKRENEALWRELASLRQKHAKQTQIVSKLLQFLVGMMSQQTPRLAFKRRMPLMLNDKDGVKQKLSRTDVNTNESTGPVIHDVTELLESDNSVEDDSTEQECLMSSIGACDKFSVQSPMSVASKSPYPVETTVGPESPGVMFSIDPVTANPTVPLTVPLNLMRQSPQSLDNKNIKPKLKSPVKKNPIPSATATSVKSEIHHVPYVQTAAAPQTNIQPQILQIPGISTLGAQTQNNVNVPTTLYFSAPGMSEPVQVVLSIPGQTNTTMTSTPSMTNVATPIVLPSTSGANTNVASKSMHVQQQQQQQQQPLINVPANKNPVNNGDPNARSQAVNPKIFLKSNGNGEQQDFDGHLDEVELGLNSLRDLFKGNDYHVDNDTLVGVSSSNRAFFNLDAIDPETYKQLFDGSAEIDNVENQTGLVTPQVQPVAPPVADPGPQRQEMITYNPSLFELAEEDTTFFDESSNMFLDDELESMLTTDRDTLKRPDSHSVGRAAGYGHGHLSFSGINLNNSFVDSSGLNTPMAESFPSPLGVALTGAGKRKRK